MIFVTLAKNRVLCKYCFVYILIKNPEKSGLFIYIARDVIFVSLFANATLSLTSTPSLIFARSSKIQDTSSINSSFVED